MAGLAHLGVGLAAKPVAPNLCDPQTHIKREQEMEILQHIGILLAGIGLFFMGLKALYWMSIKEEEKKAKT